MEVMTNFLNIHFYTRSKSMNMKALLTKPLYILLPFFLLTNISFAQPVNDDVCDALSFVLDGPPVTISNIGATVQSGENTIVPPTFPDCSPGGWCDQSHPNGGAGMDNSLWFSFVAPMDMAVEINLCASSFDTQLALYEVGDCSDFSSFNLIWATDDQLGCGINDLASTIVIKCLNPGEKYFLVVDGWQNSTGTAVIDGDVVLEINTFILDFTDLIVDPVPIVVSPKCPGGNDGSIDIDLINGIPPITYLWNTGDTTQDITGLSAGTYQVTITDFCGSSLVQTFDLEDPVIDSDLPLTLAPANIIHPAHCGSGASGGQIALVPTSGVPPHSYQWSTGDITPVLTQLTDGIYEVTVTDFCNLQSTEQSYFLGATGGPDIEVDCSVGFPQIGIDNSTTGGELLAFACNKDTLMIPGPMCANSLGYQDPTSYWKAFDPADDWGITGEFDLEGFQVYIRSLPNFDLENSITVKAMVYIANTPDLDAPDLQLIPLDSVVMQVPEMTGYTPFTFPLKASGLGPNDVLAFRVENQFTIATQHQLFFGVNSLPTMRPTYLSAAACGEVLPVALPDLGFDDYLISKVLVNNKPFFGSNLVYQWSLPVDDPSSPTPTAELTDSPTTYTVTITDQACGVTFVDEVVVSCEPTGTNDLLTPSFSISPNPSDGIFYLKNKGIEDQATLQVYNVQGALLIVQELNLIAGNQVQLDLSRFRSGMYLLKIRRAAGNEVHRLVHR